MRLLKTKKGHDDPQAAGEGSSSIEAPSLFGKQGLRLLFLGILCLVGVSFTGHALGIQAKLAGCGVMEKKNATSTTTIATTSDAKSTTTSIPRQIFLFWGNGFENAIPMAKMVKQLAQFQNPHYKFFFLTETTADEMSDRKDYIDDSYWKTITVQGKSDIYRTMLIYKHGGIWMDASVQANKPFDEWLNLDSTDLVTFQRLENADQMKKWKIDPWITSWFLAAPPKAPMTTEMFNKLTDKAEQKRFKTIYFWFHRMVSDIAADNVEFRNRLKGFTHAGDHHCQQMGWRQAPIIKRCKSEKMAPIFAVSKLHCCTGNNSTSLAGVCQEWDCNTMLTNEDIFVKYEADIEFAFGGVLPSLDSWDKTSPRCIEELAEAPCEKAQ